MHARRLKLYVNVISYYFLNFYLYQQVVILGRGGAMLTPNELVFTFGVFYVCASANFGENRSRNATRVHTDGCTDTLTDANRFLANVNSCSCSLYVVVRPSVVCRLFVVCLSVCLYNVRAPYSAD